MIDWTMSNIIYYGDKSQITEFIGFAKNGFNPFTLYQSYLGISLSAQKLIEKGKNHYKKYLYILRGILNAQWIFEKSSLPPFLFEKVAKELTLPKEVQESILRLLEKKRLASENSEVQEELEIIRPFIDNNIIKKEEKIMKLIDRRPNENDFKKFDSVIQRIIGYKSE